MSKFPLTTLISLLILAVATPFSLADTPAPPSSYVAQSADGQFLFVMIAPPWSEERAAKIQAIRKKYRVSGLYRNDGSSEPLWAVGWYAYGVIVASDGSHVIRHGPWASSSGDEAFTFFADGREIRSYRINELVGNPEFLPHSVSHFMWLGNHQLDDSAGTWAIRTLNGEYYTFDISTGEILSSFRLRRWIFGVGVPIIVVALVLLLRRGSLAKHVITMSVVSCLWALVVLFSDGDLSRYEIVGTIPLGLLLIGVAGVAFLPAGVYWALKRKRMPGAIALMWALWCLATLWTTYGLLGWGIAASPYP